MKVYPYLNNFFIVLYIMYIVHVYTCSFFNFAYWNFCIVIYLVVINYTYLLKII